MNMNRGTLARSLTLILALSLLAGCSGGPSAETPAAPGVSSAPSVTPAPNRISAPTVTDAPGATSAPSAPNALSAANLNLIFVITPDLAYQAPGDVNPQTANLTNQGLQRSLLMATYLKTQVLGGQNVHRIYALEPMTHLQTANQYPDMAAIGYIQQFAMLNQIALTGWGGYGSPQTTVNSYPLSVTYAAGPVPSGVIAPYVPCPSCQGLDYNDTAGANEALVSNIFAIPYPGFYVFSAPWETVSRLMTSIDQKLGSKLSLPAAYAGPNQVYAISITPAKSASLKVYDSQLNPPSAYPVLPSPVGEVACTAAPFSLTATDGVNGAKAPAGINTNETLYMIRHVEAHPAVGWDDGNYVAAGQWRALDLPNALRGKISPTEVYSIDPAQATNAADILGGATDFSYVRATLTVEPYAIANNLPYHLVSEFSLLDPKSPQMTADKFFTGGAFSNKTILLAWEHEHFPPIAAALLASYFPAGKAPKTPDWASADYDSLWTVTLDAKGNLTIDNSLCEGIDSTKLPAEAPQY
jgi:hypothetical protein